MRCSTCSCTDARGARSEEGQASVEAALLLPALMVCLALLVQPACMLYTRAVMQFAAAEACRLVATPPSTAGVADQAYRSYIERRLSAVPDAAVFHKGGAQGWTIDYSFSPEDGVARVSIETSVQPLPLLGVAAALLGETDGEGGVVLRVEVEERMRPTWVEGDYGAWSSLWD